MAQLSAAPGGILTQAQTDSHVGLSNLFLSVVAHDLRNPIHLVKMNADLLKKEIKSKKSAEKLEHRISNIQRISESMGRLVDLLLDASECKTGVASLPIQKRKTELFSVLESAVENYSLLCSKSNVNIRLYTIGGVDFLVSCDSDRIEQVFGNLLDNAIKYSPRNSDIVVVLEKKESCLRVCVKNEGCLLNAQYSGLIFDRNFVFDARSYGAKGLGLFICKLIIEAHGGKIWAEVDSGIFRIYFELPF